VFLASYYSDLYIFFRARFVFSFDTLSHFCKRKQDILQHLHHFFSDKNQVCIVPVDQKQIQIENILTVVNFCGLAVFDVKQFTTKMQANPLRFDLTAADITRRTEEIIAESTRTLDDVAKVTGIVLASENERSPFLIFISLLP